jgi:hypothetical protein
MEIQDDLAGSGVEETFGTAVSAVDDAALPLRAGGSRWSSRMWTAT